MKKWMAYPVSVENDDAGVVVRQKGKFEVREDLGSWSCHHCGEIIDITDKTQPHRVILAPKVDAFMLREGRTLASDLQCSTCGRTLWDVCEEEPE